MRKLILFTGILVVLATSMTCQKKACLVVIEEPPPPNHDTVSMNGYIRNDIPPPPTEPWWTLDTTNLDECQSRLWGYLKRMYPNREEDYWGYETYSIMGEPSSTVEPSGLHENWKFIERFTYFFIDTIYHLPCMNVDSSFFLQALGQPTCKSYKGTAQTNYFYSFKLQYRRGPCPNIFNQGSSYEHPCDVQHFKYCGLMKMSFRNDTGKMIYIDFFGS